MSENKDRYHDTVLDLEAKLKKNVDLILKLGNSLQGMFMLGPKPLSVYDQQLKHGLGYPNPYTLKKTISQCPKLYLASSLGNLEISLNVRDIEDTLDDAFKKKLEDENVSLDFTVQSLIKERGNVKLEYQKLFNSIKKTRSQTQTEMDELIAHVSEKTYAYGAIRTENQNLLFTISELKTRLEILKKTSPAKQRGVNSNKNVITHGMYKVVTTHESQTNETKHDLSSTRMNAASSVRRSMNRDSHVKDSVLTNSKKPTKKVAVYVRKNKKTDITSETIISNKENVMDIDVANSPKAKTLLCVFCLGHNLFSVGQFCDGDLEVAFRSKTCYVRNLEGDDLLTGDRESNLYTISISDMAASSPVCLMSRKLRQNHADVHPDELCPPNKRYDLMDANKKVDLEHVQCPPESKILTNIIKNHPLHFSIAASSSVPRIYMAQFWHTLKEDGSKYRLRFMLDKKELSLTLDDFRSSLSTQAIDNNQYSFVATTTNIFDMVLLINNIRVYNETERHRWDQPPLQNYANGCIALSITFKLDYEELLLGRNLLFSLHPTSLIRIQDLQRINRRHKDKVGMQIPDWMITEEMKHTENYKMYAKVFGLDVPLTQFTSLEEDEITDEVYELKRREKGKIVEELRRNGRMIAKANLYKREGIIQAEISSLIQKQLTSIPSQVDASVRKDDPHECMLILRRENSAKRQETSEYEAHMTRNRSYLTDYEEIDEGFVAFGGNSKGGKITGKGGLTCLFAKATPDESNLWHRRLGHVNFKTMNKLGKDSEVSMYRRSPSEDQRVNAGLIYNRIELPNDLNMPELEDIVYSDDDEERAQEGNISIGSKLDRKLCEDELLQFNVTKVLQVEADEDGDFYKLSQKYMTDILGRNLALVDVKTASTPMETHKPFLLKDAIYCLLYVMCQDSSYPECGTILMLLKEFLRYLKDSARSRLWLLIPQQKAEYVAALRCLEWNEKAAKDEIGKGIRVNAGDSKLMLLSINLLLLQKVNAARHNLLLLVDTVKAKTVNGEVQLQALVDKKKNVDSSVKFLMYPRFVQVFLDKQVGDMSTHDEIFVTPSHTKKVFGNMKRVGKGFSIVVTPLFPTMMVQAQEEMGKGSANPTDPHHTPIITQPSISQPQKKQKPRKPKRKDTEIPQSSGPTVPIADEAANEENVPTHSNDPLLSRQSWGGKKKGGSRTHKLKRLFKVSRSTQVVSSKDEGLGDQKDASKQGRKIDDIDQDAEVTLVDETQGRYDDAQMFDTDVFNGEEVFVAEQSEIVVEEVVSTAEVSAAATITTEEITLAQALAELRSVKPKVVVQEPVQSITTTTPSTIPKVKSITFRDPDESTTRPTLTPIPSNIKDKGKAKMIEPEKPLKMKEQIYL
ncbi:integrase, catalytic region, zinc finger, CCHC-type containing protein [Tanacetum coccineum]